MNRRPYSKPQFQWVDETSYAMGQRGKAAPRVWACYNGSLCVVITRLVHRDGWFLSCKQLAIQDVPLPLGHDLVEIRREALHRVREHTERLHYLVTNLADELGDE
jgi:hypothetical protein